MSTGSVVFTQAHVFDGEQFLDGPRDVVVRDGVVEEVGAGIGADQRFADIERRVDVGGATLLPGLTDLHVHVAVNDAGDLGHVSEPFSLGYYRSVQNMALTLEQGITSVRDAGGAELGARVAVERGYVEGPRLRLAVSIMSQTGGHGDGPRHSGIDIPLVTTTPGRPRAIADGPDECRKVTRELLRAGADHIKICSTGGVLSPADDPRHSQFTVPEIRAIVEEAEAQGTYVMAHAQGTAGIRNALEAGVRTIEHGIYLDEETIALMLEKDAWLVPTLVAPVAVVRAANRPGSSLPPAVVDKAERVVDIHRANVQKAYEAGVRIGFGTDTGVGPHGTNTEELALLAEIGMGLDEILRCATSDAGTFIGDAGYGLLRAGSVGDAVVLDTTLTSTDQLAEYRSSVRAVYQDGVPKVQRD